MTPIDLRSDTVTHPTPAMRKAMAEAPVGDDVFGEDPTVNRLQEMAAELMGKEAALFVTSGTQGNLLAVLAHCPERGQEVYLGDESHIYHYEQGGASAVGSLVLRGIRTEKNGELPLELIRGAVRDPSNVHFARPGVICLENTHNRCGGAVLGREYLRKVGELARALKLPLHLDGARLGNAAVALGVGVKALCEPFDSVQFDLSKGLGAPVGGVVAGTTEFVARVRRGRKMVGGGMRQAGVIAAAGIVAIEQMIGRLAEDHDKARRLAEGIAGLPGVEIDLGSVQTNIVLATVRPPLTGAGVLAGLRREGVLAGSPRADRIRFVTHYDVTGEQVEEAIRVVRRVMGGMG